MADWAYVAIGFAGFAGALGAHALWLEHGIRRLRRRPADTEPRP